MLIGGDLSWLVVESGPTLALMLLLTPSVRVG